ncbi:histidine kinase [Halobacteria archaeon AArc-dxtr1]|nr:histidine kinase [Halobacteria archaeon AArc-dxtr1]
MNSLHDVLETVRSRQKTLEVYTDDEDVTAELKAQFSTRNVDVVHHDLQTGSNRALLVMRDETGEFSGALSLETFNAILSPEISAPWEPADAGADLHVLFRFLDETIFTAYDRRQMLATTREIEERAWRVDDGTLYVGFQRVAAFKAQFPIYERFAHDSDVSVRIFVEDEWSGAVGVQHGTASESGIGSADASTVPSADAVNVISDAGGELGQFWFVIFDGGGSELNACGLLAVERDPGRYYGFWTYDPALVDEIVSYLRSTYGA